MCMPIYMNEQSFIIFIFWAIFVKNILSVVYSSPYRRDVALQRLYQRDAEYERVHRHHRANSPSKHHVHDWA